MRQLSSSYLDYLFLDIFSMENTIKTSSLYHILTGKRTVSVMMQAFRHELEAYYGFFPKLQQDQFERKIKTFKEQQYLLETEEGFLLSEKGFGALNEYFSTHTRITQSSQLRYALILPVFRQKILFLSQVLSEISYQNKQYLPLENREIEQYWLKKFLSEFNQSHTKSAAILGEEWIFILEEAQVPAVHLFIEQFEGHEQIRKTSKEIAVEEGIEVAEVKTIWHVGWLKILEYLAKNQSTTIIFTKLFEELTQHAGLCSQSCQESYLLWQQGQSLEQIANQRQLKNSTISDHFTEWAILYADFPYDRFLKPDLLRFIKLAAENGKMIHYQELKKQFPTLSFFESRLMQIMNQGLLQ